MTSNGGMLQEMRSDLRKIMEKLMPLMERMARSEETIKQHAREYSVSRETIVRFGDKIDECMSSVIKLREDVSSLATNLSRLDAEVKNIGLIHKDLEEIRLQMRELIPFKNIASKGVGAVLMAVLGAVLVLVLGKV